MLIDLCVKSAADRLSVEKKDSLFYCFARGQPWKWNKTCRFQFSIVSASTAFKTVVAKNSVQSFKHFARCATRTTWPTIVEEKKSHSNLNTRHTLWSKPKIKSLSALIIYTFFAHLFSSSKTDRILLHGCSNKTQVCFGRKSDFPGLCFCFTILIIKLTLLEFCNSSHSF